jgi:PAS domain S-box-containing protein
MKTKQIHVLLLEDEAAHVEAIRRTLESAAGLFKVQHVGTVNKFRDVVAANQPDIALLDLVLPDGNSVDLLSSAQGKNAFPMLILTSHGNEQAAVAALKKGALDYIVKSPETFANMPRIVTSALNQWASIQGRKKAEQGLQISEANFRNSIENSPLGIRIVSEEGETLYANQVFLDIYGYKNIEEFKITPVNERYAPESYLEFQERREKRQRREPLPDNYDVTIMRKDGGERHLHVVRKEIMWAGKQQYQTIYQDITEQKRVEEALRESEEKYRLIVEKSNDILFTFNAAGVLLYMSPSVKTLLGYNQADLMGHNFRSIVHPEDMPNLLQVIQRNMRDGTQTPSGNIYRVRNASGDWRWHNVSGNAVNDANGKFLYFMAITRDITERFQAEDALKASEEKYSTLVEQSTDGILILVDRRVVFANQKMKDMTGLSDHEILGKAFYELTAPEYKMMLDEIYRKRQAGKELSVNHELEILTKDGKKIAVETKLQPIDYKGIKAGMVIIHDISERKRAEEVLRKSEERMHLAGEVAHIGTYEYDFSTGEQFWSKEFKALLGLRAEEPLILDKNLLPICIHPVDYQAFLKAMSIANSPDGNGLFELDYRVIRPDSSVRWLHVRGLTEFNKNGVNRMPQHAIGAVIDITERKQTEEKLKASEQNFRNSMDNSSIGIRIMGDADSTLYANKTLLDMFGYESIDELRTSPPQEHYSPESYAGFLERHEKFLLGETLPDKLEFDIIRKDGALKHIQITSNQVFWDGKQRYQILYNDITERIEAEKALKESETRYHQLVDTITSGVFIFKAIDNGEDFIVVDVNNAAEKMEGISRKDVIGKRITEILPGSKEYEMFKAFQKVWRTGNSEYFSAYRRNSDMDPSRWRDNWAYKMPSGEIVNVYDDITDRKLAEKALQESETYLRATLNSTADGILVVDNNQKIIHTNDRFVEMFHIPRELIIQKDDNPVLELVVGQMKEPESFVTKVKQLYSSNQLDRDILYLKDGRVFERYSEPLIIQNKNGGRVWSFRDITELLNTETALRESEQNYRLIVENTRDMIFTINDREEYVYVSPAVKEMLGYNENELIGKPFLSLVNPEDIPIMQEETRRSQVPGYKVSSESEYRMRHASGEWRWVVSRGTRVVDKNGRFLHFLGIARDITDRKHMEAEKERIEEKAQIAARLAAIGEMAAGVAHEINNPLTGVLGFSQMIMENENIPEDLKQNLRRIADGSQRMAEIVKRLLMFARQAKPFKTSVNINEIIQNTLKLREYVLKTNNIEVITRLDPELPWVSADPGQMQQVFLNLIVNGEQAMRKAHGRGTLRITTERRENNIHIVVQDDGPGISRENLRRLFEPFFTTKDPGEGTGLGLSLSRSIILEHNGTINVESELRHGATFVIELPITDNSPIETETVNPVIQSKPLVKKNARILVIDDEPSIRELLEKSLSRAGHSVDVITDAASTMEIIDANTTYDVIISDVRMPGMNGLELYTNIVRKMPAMANRIIFITGDVMGADIKAFISSNNIPYLTKPFRLNSLEEMIDNILRDKHKIT